jgi:hypothetical protein
VSLTLEDIPEEFKGGNFSNMGIVARNDGTLVLFGQREEGPPIAAPLAFSI